MTPLDDAFAHYTRDRLLLDPRADGTGITVAVVDTGIDRGMLADRHPGAVIQTFLWQNRAIVPSDAPPSSPHGTTVADILLTVAPKIQLLSIDLFSTGQTECDAVVAALDFVRQLNTVRVVNLSLGVLERNLNPAKRQALSKAVEQAYFAGITVVAAANNDHPFAISYPAAFAPPLLSVDKGLFADPLEFRFDPHDGVEFLAQSKGYLGPFVQEPATSWATPHLAAIAAKLLSLKPDLKPFEIKAILYRLASPKAS